MFGGQDSTTFATFRGSWVYASSEWRYYFLRYPANTSAGSVAGYYANAAGSVFSFSTSGLPTTYVNYVNGHYSIRRPSAFLQMESGDKLVVYTSYEYMSGINQFVCTMSFYYAASGSTSYRKLRTTIQYDLNEPASSLIDTLGIIVAGNLDQTSGNVFAASSASGKFFVVANDGTKAVRFTYTLGVEGMLEPIIPIDLDANRLQITAADGTKSYGKYHQFLPHAMTKINGRHYLNGQMIRTYSNGDQNVMEVYIWSDDGINWAIGDVSSFIDAKYYKKTDIPMQFNYALVYPAGGSTMYALGNNCYTYAAARAIDKNAAETNFSEVVIDGQYQSATNSTDALDLTAMKGFTSFDPATLGGKTITLNLGYYDSSNTVLPVKMGEFFVESEQHVLSNIGRGPNKILGADVGSWKLTRWTSITDIDRWSSTSVRDDLKMLSKLVVKGISSDYKAIDNATASGLYLNNLNDPFVGYTSTKDDRDGLFTVCARFVDTGNKTKLSSIGLLIGAEDYTDIYTNGAADRKGWNALMIPAESDWAGHIKTGPQMLKSNLKRRQDDPSTLDVNESDVDRAYQWTRRFTSLWERGVYSAATGTDSPYNTITTPAATGSDHVISTAAWTAKHDTDYEFVLRKQSGRAQLFARIKGLTAASVAATATAYTDYTLIHEYQFGKDDRINWGPRPYWGFVANTDVFASLDGWNSREYGNIESTITEAYNNVGFSNSEVYNNFPDSMLVSSGFADAVLAQGYYTYNTTSSTTWQWNEREPSSGGGYYDKVTTSNTTSTFNQTGSDDFYLVQECTHNGRTVSVGEIVRVFGFLDMGGAVTNTCTLNIVRDGPGKTADGKQEFIGIIGSIEDIVENPPVNPPKKKIRFIKTWNGIFANPKQYGSTMRYAMYKLGPGESYAKLTSGSISANFMTAVGSPTVPVDIKSGGVRQASVSAGRAAIINRQNDAIFIRMMDSDGSTHTMYDASNYTKLGFDWPTTPISKGAYVGSYVNNDVDVSTRDWRLLMYQGRLFPMSSTAFGLPSGLTKSYMIKGEEIVRYTNWGFTSRAGTSGDTVWCVIPAFYTPIFPSVKNSTTIQQWSVYSNGSWIEPGDKFNEIQDKAALSGLSVYINSKGGYSSIEGEPKYYAVSAIPSDGQGNASVLTISPALKSGVESMNPATERAKDVDKQLKEVAIVSGREQFGTSSGMQSYTDPLCFYPIGPSATGAADAFIKVHYWNANIGLYNSARDNLKYVCNLAGVSEVKFMDKSGTFTSSKTIAGSNQTDSSGVSAYDYANFLVDLSATLSENTQLTAQFRNAYKLFIDVNTVGSRGILKLTLQIIAGFALGNNATGNNAVNRTIARVSVPVSDIALTGVHDIRLAVRKERVIVEMDNMPVWAFDLKTYAFGGVKNDQYTLFTDAPAPVTLTASNAGTVSYTLVELSDEVENQIIDMSQSGGDAVQFITRERHIHVRSTQNGGVQFGRFLDGNREYPLAALPTEDYIKDQLEYNPFQVPGHVLVTGAEYGEHIDPEWIRQNGYLFNSNQNRLLDTVEDSVREAKLLVRMTKEDSDNSGMEMVGVPHIQPEDGIYKTYSYPAEEAASAEDQIVSGHSIQFDASSMRSQLKIRKKYSLG